MSSPLLEGSSSEMSARHRPLACVAQPSSVCDCELLKRSLLLLGLRPASLLLAWRSSTDRWFVELALRSAHVMFDGWRARCVAPAASPDDLARAQAWFEVCCSRVDEQGSIREAGR